MTTQVMTTAALKVERALEPLQSAVTVDQVAELLRAAGVRGKRASACWCVLAQFIRARLAGEQVCPPFRAEVYPAAPEGAVALICDVAVGTQEFRAVFGPAALEFVRAFDGGRYPDLETQEVKA